VWRARYEVGEGEVCVVYEVPVESRECPVARISRQSMRWIAEFARARRVHEASGGVMGGPDSGQWRARWFDAVELIQGEIERGDQEATKAAVRKK
jgi:hypothetical protein